MDDVAGSDAAPPRPTWRRVLPLALAGVGLYVVWPSLVDTWAAAPTLRDADPWWFAAMAGLQAGSLLCLWRLQQLALGTDDLLLVATSHLAANAVGKVVPAGGAAAAALQHRMLVRGRVDEVRSVTGVTVVAILTNTAAFLMPVLVLPTLVGPGALDPGLAAAAWTGVAVAGALAVVGTALLTSERLVRGIGTVIRWADRRLRRPTSRDPVGRLVDGRRRLLAFLGPRWRAGVAWTVARLGLDYLSLLAALAAVDARPRPALVVLALVAALVLGAIPITPGGLGFVEAGLSATLTLSGVPASAAATATLAYRLVSYWVPMVMGGPAWLVYDRRHPDERDRAGPPSPRG